MRISYAVPMGPIENGRSVTHLSDLETASVPIGIDAGYRFNKRVYVGGTLAWGAGVSPNSHSTCPGADSCFRQNAELLVDARFYLAPEAKSGWWLAFGAGWEVAAFSEGNAATTVTTTLTGPVLANFQLGLDVRNGLFDLGPYLGLAIGEFLSQGTNPSATPVSTWIPNPGVHGWLSLGVRGSYGPW
jgi:hypothetical protein